jgi:hypothetical protein
MGNQTAAVYVTKCNLAQPIVESQVTCAGRSCTVHAKRQISPGTETRFNNITDWNSFRSILDRLPVATGTAHSGTSAPTEHYLAGSSQLFNVQDYVNLEKVDPTLFSLRFTSVFNAFWQASQTPQYVLGNFPTDLSAYSESNSSQTPFLTVPTTAQLSLPKTVFKADRVWIGLLLATTLLLQICAAAGLVIKYLCTVPDILGCVSTMTRENPFISLPEGGNTLDGLERARLLSDMRLQIADVKRDSDVGHLALKTVDGTLGLGRAEKGRHYL